MKRLCAAVELNWANYYRHRCAPEPVAETMVLRDQMQKIAVKFPAYGYRRISQELKRRVYVANHKRVLRRSSSVQGAVLPLDGLGDPLCIYKVVLVRFYQWLHKLSWN